MRRKIIYKREDNHEVYYRIIPFIKELDVDNIVIYKRILFAVTSDFWVIRFVFQFISDIYNCFKILFCKNKVIFVREFYGLVYFLFAPLYFVINILNSNKVYLNINHNLNNVLESVFILQKISKIYNVSFIEPSKNILDKYPWLTVLSLSCHANTNTIKKNNISVFVGKRKEQYIIKLDLYISELKKSFQDIAFYGKYCDDKVGIINDYITNEKLRKNMAEGVIILLYNPDVYRYRHSGFCLESIICSANIFLPYSELFNHYSQKFNNVNVFKTPEELVGLLQAYNSDHYCPVKIGRAEILDL